jgi:hypothetical protein
MCYDMMSCLGVWSGFCFSGVIGNLDVIIIRWQFLPASSESNNGVRSICFTPIYHIYPVR